jgi:hypothetical protein
MVPIYIETSRISNNDRIRMDPKLSFKKCSSGWKLSRCPDAVPVCLLLSDLQLAAVGGAAVIRIVKVAVLVEDESYMRSWRCGSAKFFGLIRILSALKGLSHETGFCFC